MQLVTAALNEQVEQSHQRAVGLLRPVLLTVELPHLLTDLSLLVGRVQVRHLTAASTNHISSRQNNNNKWLKNFDEKPHRRGELFTGDNVM